MLREGGEMVRWWRLALLVLAGVVVAAAGTVLAVALNVATGGTARWFPAVQRHPLWWTAGAFFKSTISGTYTVDGAKSTGKFHGGTGHGTVKDVFQAYGPRLKNGECNQSNNAQPLANGALSTFYASGPLTVSSS